MINSSDLRAVAAGLLIAVSAPVLATAESPRNTLVVAQDIGGLISLDPAEAFEEMSLQMTSQLYGRLITYDPTSETGFAPQIAESWTVSEDGRVYTFRIRENLSFASGNPVTAEDVVFSLRRVALLKKSPSVLLRQIGLTADTIDTALAAPAPDTFVLTLPKQFAEGVVIGVLSSLSGSVVDSAVVESHAVDGDFGAAWLRANSAGSGPFALRRWEPNQLVMLERFEGYQDGAPALERIIFRHVKEPGTQRLLLGQGDVDMAMNLDADQLASLSADPAIKVESFPRAQLIYLALNQKNEDLANPKVIEALRHAIDYEGISRDVLRGQYVVHQSFWPAGAPWSLEETPYALDLEKARGLLGEAGLDGPLSFELDVINQYPYVDIAQAMQASMAEAGIEVTLVTSDQKAFLGKYRARNHDAALAYWGPDYLDINSNAVAFAWNPDNSDDSAAKMVAWRNAWDIPEMTRTVEALSAELDEKVRFEGYRALQETVQREAPMIFVFQRSDRVAMSENVSGLAMGPLMDQFRLEGVEKR